MHAKLGIGFGTQPGYCSTWITGVTSHKSVLLAAATSYCIYLGSIHILPIKKNIMVFCRILHVSEKNSNYP